MSGNARVKKAIDYILQCLGAPYVWWYDGPLTEGPPSWSANTVPPDPSEVVYRGGFCAAAGNLMLRVLGLPIPNPYGDENWDGGTYAYYRYYYNSAEWFDVNKSYPDGTLLIADYVSPSLQGHVSIVYQGYVIEWIGSEGLIWKYDVPTSNNWGLYTLAVLPENWLGSEPISEPTPGTGTPMTVDHLLSVYSDHLTREDAERYFPHMIDAFREFELNTRDRVAAFLGQSSGEANEFTYWSEIDPPPDFGAYYGRGPMGVTWEAQYQWITDAYNQAHPEDPQDFHANPDLIATPKYGFWGSCWFWRNGNGDLNSFADQRDFEEIMTRCYGAPITGWSHDFRVSYYQWGLSQLPADLTISDLNSPPTQPPVPPDEEDIVYAKVNLVAAPDVEFACDYADMAETVMRQSGESVLFFDEPENIKRVSEAAASSNNIQVVVVGNETKSLVTPGGNIIPCYVDDPEDEPVDTLRVMRNHILSGSEVEQFDKLLTCLNEDYRELIENAKKPGKEPAEPPKAPAPLVNWSGFGKDGTSRMGGDWHNGYLIWPDPAANKGKKLWVEYVASYQEDN